jgi:hypothetical protein
MAFDRRRGGFGDAPKFPRPSELLFLLREHARTGAQPPLTMAVDTLRAMALGGMRDHVGGGFHRYSVDGDWRVPHFEKMLYDQAQLVLAYLEASQAAKNDFFAVVAEDTIAYVLRDMRDKDGAFYSAEDADSTPLEGGAKKEGAFYVWAADEIDALLGDDAPVVRARFGIEPDGNAPSDPQGEFTGQNILYTSLPIEDIAIRTGRSEADVIATLGRARDKMLEARAKRHRPHLDDKVITAWNGLMIAALARAARVLPERPAAAGWLDAARSAADFIRRRLWNSGSHALLRRYREGEAGIDAYAEDYACLIWGLLELFQADGDPRWFTWARELQRRQDTLFWDAADAGWFSTTGQDPTVLLRLKEDYDGAEPSASSVAVHNLLAIAHLADDADSRTRAERTLGRYGPRAGRAARAIPMMLAALSAWHAGATQIVIVGEPRAAAPMRAEVARVYAPFALVVSVEPGERQRAIAAQLPFVESMGAAAGRATAYVCRDFACREPVTTSEALRAQLESHIKSEQK